MVRIHMAHPKSVVVCNTFVCFEFCCFMPNLDWMVFLLGDMAN